MPFAMSWIDLMGIVLSEVSHAEKEKCHVIALMYRN